MATPRKQGASSARGDNVSDDIVVEKPGFSVPVVEKFEAKTDEEEEVPPEQTPDELPEPPPAHALVDPESLGEQQVVEMTPLIAPENVSVVVLRNEDSVTVGSGASAGHYSLRAGSTMVLQKPIADELVQRRLVRYS